jgi:hypothetical protein
MFVKLGNPSRKNKAETIIIDEDKKLTKTFNETSNPFRYTFRVQ